MAQQFGGARILIYSHDSFGLGHLRRCQTIARALVERFQDLSVMILSGSPIIGAFDFPARVDFVRIPGIIKLYDGDYTSLGLHIDLKDTLAIRASIIEHTAAAFAPDIFIVDKEPLGLRGEIRDTLEMLRRQGTTLVLGLRDVLDAPHLLRREWEARKLLPVLDSLYDEIWVFGLESFWDPLRDLGASEAVRRKMAYTGYLHRTVPPGPKPVPPARLGEPYVLVTPGGGGDGEEMIDWALRAYEADPDLPFAGLFVLGPFMPSERRAQFQARADRLRRVETVTFDAHLELLMEQAVGVVAMGGYNTFCELLSLDKPSILVPRHAPRQEQLVRASRASDLDLVRMLDPRDGMATDRMVAALRALPAQTRPSAACVQGLLDGLDNVARLAERHLSVRRNQPRAARAGG
ncbi:MAG: glycosyltransferase family protein [Alphaproteobacteria bacterium]